jgi:2-hydroxy-3-keto-5-methylthiopentenyl-1-phosphate phosphatase
VLVIIVFTLIRQLIISRNESDTNQNLVTANDYEFKGPSTFLMGLKSDIKQMDHTQALLTRREMGMMLNMVDLSNSSERDIRYRIRKKMKVFCAVELPLLIESGLVDSIVNDIYQMLNERVVIDDDNIAANDDVWSKSSRWSSLDRNEFKHASKNNEKKVRKGSHKPTNDARDPNLGRVGFEPTTPAMSRRYLNQAGPPALLGCSRVLA